MTEEQKQRTERIQRIDGEHVYLRRITTADTEKVVRWRNMPHVMKWFIHREPVTVQDHERWLSEKVAAGAVEQFIIVVRDGSREIGSQYFSHIDPAGRSAEYGIFIGEKDALGHNYGTEVLQLALDYAFTQMHLQEVTLRALADNERAIRSYESCGFRLCPELTQEAVLEGIRREIIFMKKENTGKNAE